jgi:WD40 repeat protein
VVTSDSTGVSWIWSLAPPSSPEGKLSGDALIFVNRVTLTGHAEPVTSVSFSPDHRTIATSSDDRTLRLWDPVSGRERAVLTSHTDAVLFEAFLPEGSELLSVGREGTLKLWQGPR